MDGEITLFLLIEAALGIIVIVAYFYLCHNVSQIKRKIAPKEDNFAYHFNLLLALGKKEEAKQFLIDTMISARDDRNYGTISQIEEVIKKYANSMEKVGLTVDKEFLEAAKQQ